jgi:hypothetical protein
MVGDANLALRSDRVIDAFEQRFDRWKLGRVELFAFGRTDRTSH